MAKKVVVHKRLPVPSRNDPLAYNPKPCSGLALLIAGVHFDVSPKMKKFLTIVIFGVFAGLVTSSAMEDRVAHSSPDGSATVRNIGDTAAPDHHFQIVGRDDDVLLSSDKHSDLQTGSFAESIVWSPDGHYVAFSVRSGGPYIRDTFVYSVQSKTLARVLTEDDDCQTRPVRWRIRDTLIVQTNGPFGGKATEGKELASYRYRRTIRLSDSPIQFETLYTTPRTHPKP